MKVAVDIGKLLALVSIATLCFFLAYLAYGYKDTSDTLNKDLLLIGKATNDLRLAVDNVNDGAVEEKKYFKETLPAVTDQALVSLANTNRLITSLTATSDNLNSQITSVSSSLSDTSTQAQILLASGTQTVQTIDETAKHVDRLADSPAYQKILQDMQQTSENAVVFSEHAAATSDHIDQTTSDIQKKVHQYVNPPKAKWYQKVWGVAKFSAETAFDFIR